MSSSRQQPRKRVNLKRPNKPAASANPGRSWPPGRNEERRFTVTGRGQTAEAFLPAPNAFSSLKSVTATLRGLVCRSSSPSFLLGLAVGGRVRLSPFAALPFAAGKPHVRRQLFLSCSIRNPCRPPVSPALLSPSSRVRTPRALLHGGGCRCFQALSTPHLRYVFPYTTLWFLCRTSFTNGSVYPGYRCGFSAQFEPVTLFSLEKNPPRFDGIHLTVVNSASKASVLQQELSSLLQKEAIEEVPQSEVERGFFSRYFLVPKRDGGLRPILDLRHLNLSSSRCWRWEPSCLRSRRETGLSPSTWRMRIFTSRSFTDTGDSFGSPLEGRLTNTRSCPSAWLWLRGHLQNAWMLH